MEEVGKKHLVVLLKYNNISVNLSGLVEVIAKKKRKQSQKPPKKVFSKTVLTLYFNFNWTIYF